MPISDKALSDSDKKLHQGWGGDEGNTELKVEEAARDDAAAEAAPASGEWGVDASATAENGWGEPTPTAEGETAPAPAAPDARENRRREEEEDNTLTYDQYLAQKKAASDAPKLEARKANEGAADNLWDGVVVLNKEEEDEFITQKVS